jgi:hypothetical protein
MHNKTAHLNPRLKAAAKNSSIPRYMQAIHAGFIHGSYLSHLLHTPRPISITPLMRTRLEKLAALLNFPADQIFVERDGEV